MANECNVIFVHNTVADRLMKTSKSEDEEKTAAKKF